MKKIAILGLSASRVLAPKPGGDWDVWGLCNDGDRNHDRTFEIHEFNMIARVHGGKDALVDRLNEYGVPVFMQEHHDAIPASVRFPIEDFVARFGRYGTSSLAYMIGLAIMEGATTIGLWGVENGDGYEAQRPNLEYMIGWALGAGIECFVVGPTKLLGCERGLYGYEWP